MNIDTVGLDVIFGACLLKDEEVDSAENKPKEGVPTVTVQGVLNTFVFHKDRLEENRDMVRHMISELNIERLSQGASFLELPFLADGTQWGEHLNAEQLVTLSIGLGYAMCPIKNKEIWKALPGGMPYFYVNPEKDYRPVAVVVDPQEG